MIEDKYCAICGKRIKPKQRYLRTSSWIKDTTSGASWCGDNKNNIEFHVHYKCIPKKIRRWLIFTTEMKKHPKCPRCKLNLKRVEYGG